MPIFEYECEKCGNAFEHLAKSRSEPMPVCPECGTSKPRKLFSTFSPGIATQSVPRNCPAESDCPAKTCCGTGTCPVTQ